MCICKFGCNDYNLGGKCPNCQFNPNEGIQTVRIVSIVQIGSWECECWWEEERVGGWREWRFLQCQRCMTIAPCMVGSGLTQFFFLQWNTVCPDHIKTTAKYRRLDLPASPSYLCKTDHQILSPGGGAYNSGSKSVRIFWFGLKWL